MFSQASVILSGGVIHPPVPPWQTPQPRGGHCSGRYASYWNAFLFFCCFCFTLREASQSEKNVRKPSSKSKCYHISFLTAWIDLKHSKIPTPALKGMFTLHGNGTDTGIKWKVVYHVEMFTLVQDMDRKRDPLFPIVPVPVPVPVMVTSVWISLKGCLHYRPDRRRHR